MKQSRIYLTIGFVGLLLSACQPTDPTPQPLPNAAIAVAWGQMTLKTMTQLPANTPTYGSWALGYPGQLVTMRVFEVRIRSIAAANSLCSKILNRIST